MRGDTPYLGHFGARQNGARAAPLSGFLFLFRCRLAPPEEATRGWEAARPGQGGPGTRNEAAGDQKDKRSRGLAAGRRAEKARLIED